jgi:hypothetical protein
MLVGDHGIPDNPISVGTEFAKVEKRVAEMTKNWVTVRHSEVKAHKLGVLLGKHKPLILHVSCHIHSHDEMGSVLHLAPAIGTGHPSVMSAAEFVRCLTIHFDDQGGPQLVVLNGCNSATLARALHEEAGIPHVIGTSSMALMDTAAVYFSPEFYTHLIHGRTIKSAFAFAEQAAERHFKERHAEWAQQSQRREEIAPILPPDDPRVLHELLPLGLQPVASKYVLLSRDPRWRAPVVVEDAVLAHTR